MQRSKTLLRQDFDHTGFENLVYQNGLNLKLERALMCPCRRVDNGSPQTTCLNCNGSGWLFSAPTNVFGTIMSLKYEQIIQMTYPEISATANLILSESNDFRLSYFDKLTLQDGNGIIVNNIKQFKLLSNSYNKKTFQLSLPFRVISIDYLILYISSNSVLKLSESDYKYENNTNTIELSDSVTSNLTKQGFTDIMASIRYYHNPIYHVLRHEHNIRLSRVVDGSNEVVKEFPLLYLIREHSFFVNNGQSI